MPDHNPPIVNERCADRLAELAAMKALAEHGIHVRSSRQVRNGDFPDLPWIGDVDVDGAGDQLELFPRDTP